MDAESYSLHTFEALLTQSMENLGNFSACRFTRSSVDWFILFFLCVLQNLQRVYQVAIREVHILWGRVSIELCLRILVALSCSKRMLQLWNVYSNLTLLFSIHPGPASSASMNKSSTLPLSHRLGTITRERDRERDGYYSDRNELLREREKERERERGYLSDHNSR